MHINYTNPLEKVTLM